MLERLSRPFAGLGALLTRAVNGFYRVLGGPGRYLQDFANGTWLGHPLHPVLTDATVGGFTVVVLLDVLALLLGVEGLETATQIALGFSILSGIGTALTGLTDHKDTFGDERNLGTLHGVVNIVSLVIYGVALVLRLADGVVAGQLLGIVAYLLLSAGAYIGGHLVFKYGYMVNHNAFPAAKRAKEFTAVLPLAELPEATPIKAMLGPTALVLVRRGDVVHALKETCSHAGGPLSQGELRDGAIVCPWHFSHFRLRDGNVVHGPATSRQVSYAARINGEQVEVQGPHD